MNANAQLLERFQREQKSLAGRAAPGLAALRARGAADLARLGLPAAKDELWRWTDLKPLHALFAAPAGDAIAESPVPENEPLLAIAPSRLVFVDGVFEARLSTLAALPSGVTAGLLSDPSAPEAILARLDDLAGEEKNVFAALNTAFLSGGAWITARAGAQVEQPVHVLFLTCSGGRRLYVHPRLLVVAEPGASLTVIESHAGIGDAYFTNPVTEIDVQENARLTHYRLAVESPAGRHIAAQRARLGRNARFVTRSFAFGAALVRHDSAVDLAGEGGECVMDGLYLLNGGDHVDHHTRIDHRAPHCASRELFKGILDGRSRAVFNGLIHVHPGAQQTDARQTNRNLLLSGTARADSQPQLEIHADDVKCSHGSTVGNIEDAALFYLRARGVGEREARAMLIHAFALEFFDEVEWEPLRRHLGELIWRKLSGYGVEAFA